MANQQPSSSQWLIGVDVGGTTVATLLTDAQLRPVQTLVLATDLSSPDATLDGIAAAIQQTLDAAGVTADDVGAIGMGVPGAVDVEHGISRMAVNLHWYDYPVTPQLYARFGVPTFLENDVRVATLGVHRFDNPDCKQNLVYVSIGTGVAAGVILDGKLFRGRQGLAGEIGHWIVDPSGPTCNCGSRGCLETLVSATAVVRMGREAVAAGKPTRLSAYTPLTARDVYAAAAAGDEVAQVIVAQVGAELGRALRNVVLAYDSEAIVLGGGPTRAGTQFLQPIVTEWERQHTTSALARALLRPEMIRIADPARNMGAWGALALAAAHMERQAHG
ncbi:MAG: ROK family protein [Anaerolineales bacterium]|nr:ROK family protein [Anaerolineales bacterium]